MTKWRDYNNGLRKRGDFAIYFTEGNSPVAPSQDRSPKQTQEIFRGIDRNGHVNSSGVPLAVMANQGFMNSLAGVLKADIIIPDFSGLSKRSLMLPRHKLTKALGRTVL